MKTYKSLVSKWTIVMFFLIVLIMVAPLFFMEDLSVKDLKDTGFWSYLGITFLVIGLFLWIYFGTYYKIDNGFLYHRSAIFRGKMKISSIRKITYHSGWYVPVVYKPSTDTVGVIITYNKFEDIYFSPKERDKFVEDLLKLNPKIEIIKPEKT